MQKQVSYELESSRYGIELVDAHCHLDLFPDPKVTVSDARMAGVASMITAGGSRKSSIAAAGLADGSSVFAVVGIDPENAARDSDFIGEVKELVMANRGVVGIGEIGLDFKVNTPKDLQLSAFEKQLEIAMSLDVPVVIHSRQALDSVAEIVAKSGIKKAMFHYFEGDEASAAKLAGMGYMISIPPIESSRRRKVISALDIGSIVVETDSPVVGKSPIDVIKTVQWIAGIKGIGFDEASMKITENVKKLFSL